MIIIDVREAALARRIKEGLVKEGVQIKVEQLEVGDYFIPGNGDRPGFIIERKTATDFVGSVKSKRLWDQLRRLKNVENAEPILILESSPVLIERFTKWNKSSVMGILFSIIYDWEIPVVYTPSIPWTVALLKVLWLKVNKPGEKREYIELPVVKPKSEDPRDYALAVLAVFPGFGPAKAKAVLEKFGSLREVFRRPELIDSVPGIGKTLKKKFLEVLDSDFRNSKK